MLARTEEKEMLLVIAAWGEQLEIPPLTTKGGAPEKHSEKPAEKHSEKLLKNI
jgi:hypothetical protein